MDGGVLALSPGRTRLPRGSQAYTSFALIVICVFKSREMGHVFLAVSAAVWNFAGSAPGTFAVTSRWIDFTDQPASVLSKSNVAFASISSGRYPAFPSSLEKAIAKQLASAAATRITTIGRSIPFGGGGCWSVALHDVPLIAPQVAVATASRSAPKSLPSVPANL